MNKQRIEDLLRNYRNFSVTTNVSSSTPVTRRDLENFRNKTFELISAIVSEINSQE